MEKFLPNGDPNPEYNWSHDELTALGKRALQRLHYSMTGERTGQGEPSPPIVDRMTKFVETRLKGRETQEEIKQITKGEVIRLIPPSEQPEMVKVFPTTTKGLAERDSILDRMMLAHPDAALKNGIKQLSERIGVIEQKLDILIRILTDPKTDSGVSIPGDKELVGMTVEELQVLCSQIGTDVVSRNKTVLLHVIAQHKKSVEQIRAIMKEYSVNHDTASQAMAIHDTTGTPVARAIDMVRL